MNSQFAEYQIGEVTEIIAGGDKPKVFGLEETADLNIPVVANAERANGLMGYTNSPRIVEPAVTIAARGSNVGFVAIRKSPFFPVVRLLSLIPKSDVLDVDYLYYNLKLNRKTGTGSGQPQITIPEISDKTIFLPPLVDQIKAANILATIDKKIQLNNRINAELEAMAKTLYDYWFVQFDFPDATGKPYKSSGGKMVYNPILKREIPAGWEVNSLSSWIKSDKTGDWGKEKPEGNYALQVKCIRGADINGLKGNGNVSAPNRFILQKNNHKLLDAFDFVVEISGGSPTQSTGRMAYITEDVLDRFSYPLICSNFCKAISLRNNSLFYCFAYLWNSIYDNGVLFGWEGKTSGIKNLLFESFVSKYYVPIPPLKLAEQHYHFMMPIEEKKQKLLAEVDALSSLRDFLLPMLMNGQVTIAN